MEKLQSEAFDLVKNVSEQNGIEARRRLCNRFDALTLGKRVHLIRKSVYPPKIKNLREAMGMIERWEDSTRRLQAEYDEHISDGLKMRILLEIVRPNITESFMAMLPDKNAEDENGKEIAKYITKEILVQYIKAKTDFGGPTRQETEIRQRLWREQWRWRTLCKSVQRMWRVRTQTSPLTAKLGVLDVRRREPSRGTVPQQHSQRKGSRL